VWDLVKKKKKKKIQTFFSRLVVRAGSQKKQYYSKRLSRGLNLRVGKEGRIVRLPTGEIPIQEKGCHKKIKKKGGGKVVEFPWKE